MNLILQAITYFICFKLSSAVSSAFVGVWATGVHNNPLPYSLRMQTDGNLVIYDGKNAKVWSTSTNGRGVGPFRLVLQDSGILSVFDAKDTVTWTSGRFQKLIIKN